MPGEDYDAEVSNRFEIEFEYDAAHRMTLASDDVGTVVTLTYDDAGNVIKRKDANNHEWLMDFDAAGRLVEFKDPIVETGTDNFAMFAYDAVGNVNKANKARNKAGQPRTPLS